MKVAVCIKQVFDTEGHIEVDHSKGSVYSPNLVMNPLDLLAVEEAIRIKDRLNSVEVTVMSVGQTAAQKTLRSALSMGADKAVYIDDTAIAGTDSYVTGYVLAKGISLDQYDLIICGHKAADTQMGQVGAVIAEVLQIPLVTAVVHVEVELESKKIILHRKIGGGKREIVETSMPAVITVEAGINKPRYPTLRSIKEAEKKAIAKYDIRELNSSGNNTTVNNPLVVAASVTSAKPSLQNLFVPDSSILATDRIFLLMSGGIGEKRTDMIVGESNQAALKFIQLAKGLKLV